MKDNLPKEQPVLFEGCEFDTRAELCKKFVVPPFSVLDARQGYWRKRKKQWLALGIQSELGRGEGMTWGDSKGKPLAKVFGTEGNILQQTGTSIFDPVLTELMYRWFCPVDGSILDPFAGGSVRGIVANFLGYKYTGIDLRPEQIIANIEQAHRIMPDNIPLWIEGDARRLSELVRGKFDFVFTCPPYYNLEIYSNDKRDLSNVCNYGTFVAEYSAIIKTALSLLRNNRFACFVVGEIRNKQGFYRNFVGDTVRAFLETGAKLYNEAILLTAIGSLPIRITRQFNSNRKLGKTHQNILVFYKGNPLEIKKEFPEDFKEFS